MEEPREFEVSDRLIAGAYRLPDLLGSRFERLEGVRLSARTYAEQPFIKRALVYRCSSWHIFALFEQTLEAPIRAGFRYK
jgi:hypothetical protein